MNTTLIITLSNSTHVDNFVGTVFPTIKARYDNLTGSCFELPEWEQDRLRAAGIPASEWRYQNCFGMFAQMTVNTARPGTGGSVKLSPHVDWKNFAAGLCVVVPYGKSTPVIA